MLPGSYLALSSTPILSFPYSLPPSFLELHTCQSMLFPFLPAYSGGSGSGRLLSQSSSLNSRANFPTRRSAARAIVPSFSSTCHRAPASVLNTWRCKGTRSGWSQAEPQEGRRGADAVLDVVWLALCFSGAGPCMQPVTLFHLPAPRLKYTYCLEHDTFLQASLRLCAQVPCCWLSS